MDWSDIADKHNLNPTDRKAFFISANTLTCSLNGNVTLALVKGSDFFLSLPVGRSMDGENRLVEFREVYYTTNPKVREALDEFMDECKKWLKIK